jgi:outer membrane protein assembly factor BamD (BamD/ComL family)
VRLSQVSYQFGRWGQARTLADRAIGIRNGDQLLDEAYWMRGAAWHRQRQYWLALRDFQTLRRRFPTSPLGQGAREELAVLYETTGQFGRALNEDFALGYQADIAWLVDVKMTPADLRSYITQHPGHPQRDLLWYSLAIRHMRRGEYPRARTCFAKIKLPMTLKYGEMETGVVTYEPIDLRPVLRQLENWEAKIRDARSRDEKARALFGQGEYLAKAPDTLVYNEPAWRGVRMGNLQALHPLDAAHEKQDISVRDRYLERDNILLRAADAYERSARLTPGNRQAATALYCAAYCYLRVSNYNPLFREMNPRRGYIRREKRLWQDIVTRYPASPWTRRAAKLDHILKGNEIFGGGEHPWGPNCSPWPEDNTAP